MNINSSIRANCGVVGVYGNQQASQLVYLCLYALQHRGQEASGIVSSNGDTLKFHKALGLVSDIFSDMKVLDHLDGMSAIGHNRYSTTGGNTAVNVQPLVMNIGEVPIAISHNGNLVNDKSLRKDLMKHGSIFQTSSDSEIIIHLIAKSNKDTLSEKIKEAFFQIKGAFSIAMLSKSKLFAIRDPKGFRPLCIGKKDATYIITSESCALDLIEAEYVRDVEPGEMVTIDENGLHSEKIFSEEKKAFCIFEYIYFSRPDSKVFGENVDKTRRKFGKILATLKPAEGDIVISVPDSSNTAALGFAQESKIKFEIGLIRNHYIGRTFIHPVQSQRDFNVRIKFNPVEGVLKDRRIIIVEDSIVRGTTLKQLVKMVRDAGAKEVHVRVSSPPIISPCYYGMDFPTKDELIANNKTIDQIRKYLNVDSLEYFPLDDLTQSVTNSFSHYCHACFSGQYPIPVKEELSKDKHEKEPQES